ncbi:MAG: selenoneine biosynthesis selenosugar synthase SenB [Betaproteobacteria bacterium]
MLTAAKIRKPRVVIVSPALASANNGNWQTAKRYANMLGTTCMVRIVTEWDGARTDDVLIALHARRSYPSIAAWYAQRGSKGLCVVLTGTDLYRDIKQDPQPQQSLAWAKTLVVLQPAGLAELPLIFQDKTRVLFQSTTSRQTLLKTNRHVRAVMVGHLRSEKSPQTFFGVAALLDKRRDIELRHIGGEHDQLLAQQAHDTAAHYPNYQFLGARSHEQTRRYIQRSHVLVHPSVMEGGAHVIMEALCSGVPVLASRIAGNIGMLGEDYAGFFTVGDAVELASLLVRFREDSSFAAQLRRQCAQRAYLFEPARERSGLITIVQDLIIKEA